MWACPRALKRRSPIEAVPILTASQRAFFDQHAYLVAPDLIGREQVDAVVDAIWDFLDFDDTAAGEGGFQCVPGVHRWISEWAQGRGDEEIRDQRLELLHADAMGQAVEVEAKAGDLIIWNSALPHGNSRNRSNKPRLAQYVRLSPAEAQNQELRRQRVASWRERTHPSFQNPRAFPGDPRRREQESVPAELTPLGRRLLGLDDW